jgi:hypothetical protein
MYDGCGQLSYSETALDIEHALGMAFIMLATLLLLLAMMNTMTTRYIALSKIQEMKRCSVSQLCIYVSKTKTAT